MAQAFRAASSSVAVILAVAALASCGGGNQSGTGGNDAKANADAAPASQLFPDNFKGVCSGASVSTATAYNRQAATHKALYFATYKDDLIDQSSSLPGDWTVTWTQEGDALRAVDLVVCARRTAAQQVKVCDGYKNHDQPTQNRVNWHTATYELSVREARTGRELGKTTVEATDRECPMFQSFDSDTETVDGYASLSNTAVADFLRPHITH